MTDSWWLKFKRAQRHMVEFRYALRAYSKTQPYHLTWIKEAPGKRNRRRPRWSYILNMDPPDQALTLIFGDFIHNLRSALDHVAWANCAPKFRSNSTSFPIEFRDLFAIDSDGQFLHPDANARKAFNRAIRGISFLVKTVIIDSQPYRTQTPGTHVIGLIGRLENLDKHKGLVASGGAVRGGKVSLSIRGAPYSEHPLPRNQFFFDGAEIYSFEVVNPDLTDADVEVNCAGTATVNIKASGVEGQEGDFEFDPIRLMLTALSTVRLILRAADGAARKDASERARIESVST